MARWKSFNRDKFEEELDIGDTLQFMLNPKVTPEIFLKYIMILQEPPGYGRRLSRQNVDHYLGLLAFLSEVRRDGKLDKQMISSHNEILQRFMPLISQLKSVYGKVPAIVEEDANTFGKTVQKQ